MRQCLGLVVCALALAACGPTTYRISLIDIPGAPYAQSDGSGAMSERPGSAAAIELMDTVFIEGHPPVASIFVLNKRKAPVTIGQRSLQAAWEDGEAAEIWTRGRMKAKVIGDSQQQMVAVDAWAGTASANAGRITTSTYGSTNVTAHGGGTAHTSGYFGSRFFSGRTNYSGTATGHATSASTTVTYDPYLAERQRKQIANSASNLKSQMRGAASAGAAYLDVHAFKERFEVAPGAQGGGQVMLAGPWKSGKMTITVRVGAEAHRFLIEAR